MVRCGRGVTLTPHSLLVPRSKILSLRDFVAYEMVKPTYIDNVMELGLVRWNTIVSDRAIC